MRQKGITNIRKNLLLVIINHENMAKITENIKSLADIINTLQALDNSDFIQEQWLTPEDVELVKSDLIAKISEYKEQIQWYIEYKLWERHEHEILSTGLWEKAKQFLDRKKSEDNKIASIDSRIDFICKISKITELKTINWEIKYVWWEKMKVTDNTLLPEDMKKHVFVHTIETEDKEEKEDLIEKWYIEDIVYPGLPEIKKWFKWVMSWWDTKIIELWNNLNAGVITKEEHEEEMKKIKEEQKKYEWKIRIDDSKSISIK